MRSNSMRYFSPVRTEREIFFIETSRKIFVIPVTETKIDIPDETGMKIEIRLHPSQLPSLASPL